MTYTSKIQKKQNMLILNSMNLTIHGKVTKLNSVYIFIMPGNIYHV